MKVITTVNGTQTQHDIEAKPLTLLCHKGGIKVDVPEAFVIDPITTVNRMYNMRQEEWTMISKSEIFMKLFRILYSEEEVTLPEGIATLNSMYDAGVIHCCGLIILLLQVVCENRKSVLIRTPEANLHPSTCANLADLFVAINKLEFKKKPEPINLDSKFKLADKE